MEGAGKTVLGIQPPALLPGSAVICPPACTWHTLGGVQSAEGAGQTAGGCPVPDIQTCFPCPLISCIRSKTCSWAQETSCRAHWSLEVSIGVKVHGTGLQGMGGGRRALVLWLERVYIIKVILLLPGEPKSPLFENYPSSAALPRMCSVGLG